MLFEWDDNKNAANLKKHGIRFENAIAIFHGLVFTRTDNRTDYGEVREISTGKIDGNIVLVIVHTDRRKITRIISARLANRTERKDYHDYCTKNPE